jgi:hypothetical protein
MRNRQKNEIDAVINSISFKLKDSCAVTSASSGKTDCKKRNSKIWNRNGTKKTVFQKEYIYVYTYVIQ